MSHSASGVVLGKEALMMARQLTLIVSVWHFNPVFGNQHSWRSAIGTKPAS
jgi:hypothetical protein